MFPRGLRCTILPPHHLPVENPSASNNQAFVNRHGYFCKLCLKVTKVCIIERLGLALTPLASYREINTAGLEHRGSTGCLG